jgi:hypothetical protein
MRKVLEVIVLSSGLVLAQPAMAALGDSASHAVTDIASQNFSKAAADRGEQARADICVPPEAQFIPAFMRDGKGEIVGINYTIIEYVC